MLLLPGWNLMLNYSIYLRAASDFVFLSGIGGVDTTAAFSSLSSQKRVDDGGGTADTAIYGNCAKRAITAACSAFHAGVAVLDYDMRTIHFKYFMGTDIETHSAARAFLFIQF